MKETFTATQREIVARKMGYEGPMQKFDEFLMSTPSEAQRYSDITTKFSQKMAKGGVVRRYADGGVVPDGQKKPSEIIKEYAASIGINPRGAVFGVDALMKTGDGLLLQEHNTVMVLQKLAPKVASANIFTTDDPKVLLSSISTLVDKLKESEINIIYGDKENEEFMLGLEYKGVSLYASDIPGNDWMAKL
jgi:hypothetical protein